jgi:hypothetical protein
MLIEQEACLAQDGSRKDCQGLNAERVAADVSMSSQGRGSSMPPYFVGPLRPVGARESAARRPIIDDSTVGQSIHQSGLICRVYF